MLLKFLNLIKFQAHLLHQQIIMDDSGVLSNELDVKTINLTNNHHNLFHN